MRLSIMFRADRPIDVADPAVSWSNEKNTEMKKKPCGIHLPTSTSYLLYYMHVVRSNWPKIIWNRGGTLYTTEPGPACSEERLRICFSPRRNDTRACSNTRTAGVMSEPSRAIQSIGGLRRAILRYSQTRELPHWREQISGVWRMVS